MSISADVEFSFRKQTIRISPGELISHFLQNGLSLNVYGKVIYFPLGDDDFNWEAIPFHQAKDALSVIQKKSEQEELIGIQMVFNGTDIGFLGLFYPHLEKITLSVDINRVTIPGLETTDFTWYLKRIVPILEAAGLLIDLIECQHTRF